MNAEEWSAFVIPTLPFATTDAAADFLGVPPEQRSDKERVKQAYRKMCLKTHPDKNQGHAERAAEAFRAVTAALHTLTTTNFDFERWARNFTIPPMQSLEDVLMLALRGAHPDEIEAMLRKRGDYRPHPEFGVNLSIPWHAGGHADPAWDVPDSSEFTTTKQIGASARARADAGALVRAGDTAESLLSRLGEDRAVGASSSRPWETVGGVGFGGAGDTDAGAPPYVPPTLRPDLQPGDATAAAEADRFNDEAIGAFKAGDYRRARELGKEASRLAPDSAVYAANASAAALKLGKARDAAKLAEHAVACDGAYAKGLLRAAQAHLALETRESVQQAIDEFAKVLVLDPESKAAKKGRKEALLTWEADFEDEDD